MRLGLRSCKIRRKRLDWFFFYGQLKAPDFGIRLKLQFHLPTSLKYELSTNKTQLKVKVGVSYATTSAWFNGSAGVLLIFSTHKRQTYCMVRTEGKTMLIKSELD